MAQQLVLGSVALTPYVDEVMTHSQNCSWSLMNLPIEMFIEIASSLHPEDLIALMRTNKPLRQLLLKRTALVIWQSALKNVPGLPPCLSGMCEPQYAALMFSKYCTLCDAPTDAPPDPYLRCRLCHACCTTKLEPVESARELVESMEGLSLDKQCVVTAAECVSLCRYTTCCDLTAIKIARLCPSWRDRHRYYLREEVEMMSQKLAGLAQTMDDDGLEQWKQGLQKNLKSERQEGDCLFAYLK